MDELRRSGSVNYGQDAPGIRLGMLGIAVAGAIIFIAATHILGDSIGKLQVLVQALGLLAFLYGAWMGAYMTWSTHVGKLRTRDTLLALVGQLRPWKGDESVLDVGCGRGLMLIGAAKLLTASGTACGVDLWRSQDQSGNDPQATKLNAEREGVADRIQIRTGDARELPLPDSSVDVVMSHWVVHNIDAERDRIKALDEMWRVLRPGGVLVLADIAYVENYCDYLKSLDTKSLLMLDGGWEARVMGTLSGGTYKPQALICSK
jgi:SAM-dependent methyltransferase